MPTITISKSAGFCFGVDRAVKLCYKALEDHGHIATLGPIIHNQSVVDDLTRRGATIINDVDDLPPGECVVIRSHGVSRAVYEKLREKGNPFVDATCPFVAKIHRIVEKHTENGDFVLIAGDRNHPEVEAIVGHCKGNCFVFESLESLNSFFREKDWKSYKRLAIVAQTTYNTIIWGKCLKALPADHPNIVVYDTICHATQVRQSDADELSRVTDLMIVVGGRHSSNTVKLFGVCKRNCRSYHIEDADELYTLNLGGAKNIGITAGASTPVHIIKEVYRTMTEILENNNLEEEATLAQPEPEAEPETETEDFNFSDAVDQSFKKLHIGEKVKGVVVSMDGSGGVMVDLGAKQTGYVPADELSDDFSKRPEDVVSVGDEIDLIVTKINEQDGIVSLSKKRVDEQKGFEEIVDAFENHKILEGKVTNVVKSGVVIRYIGVRVFIPESHSGLPRGGDLNTLVGKTERFVILSINERQRKAVGSIRGVRRVEREAAREAFWETAEVGKKYHGEVKSLTSYGAFVDLGGIDGMVHISELSWDRIKHPSEVVNVGDYVDVYIKDLDRENGRISLGYKKPEDNPWVKFGRTYEIGDVVPVKIVSITPFGAFARIMPGIDGLIHISQLANRRVEDVREVVDIGDEVDVKIIGIDLPAKRVSISIRQVYPEDEVKVVDFEEPEDEAVEPEPEEAPESENAPETEE